MKKYKMYEIISPEINSIKYGEYYNEIKKKHQDVYGKSAQIIVDNVEKIYRKIKEVKKANNNLLLVGKVQSGKTSNLELLTALLFDNDYSLGIIYGGYDKTLLDQTSNRFRESFQSFVNQNEDDSLIIIDTSNDDFKGSVNKRVIMNRINEGVKVLVIALKNHQAINNVISIFDSFKYSDKLAFVIDDEGDQASLNILFRDKDESSTYKSIVKMNKTLRTPLYLSTTATPAAIVFQPEMSEIIPSDVALIEPGYGYHGPDEFHLDNKNIIYIKDRADSENYTKDIQTAIYHYLIAAAIVQLQNNNKPLNTDMIVHVSSEIKVHKNLTDSIENELKILRMIYIEDKNYFKSIIEEVLKEPYFDKDIILKYGINQLIYTIGTSILDDVYIIMQNSEGKDTQGFMSYKRHKIYIGGNLLQRGVTFKNLLTTYFTRWTKTPGNIDTTFQRARWLGYRNNIKRLMRIFTLPEIADEFSNLCEIEEDLWSQFYDCENNKIDLKDIFINLSNTGLNVSRREAIEIGYSTVRQKWMRQKRGLFDEFMLKNNNEIMLSLFNEIRFTNKSLGWNDGKINVQTANINFVDIKEQLSKLKFQDDFFPTIINNSHLFQENAEVELIKMFLDDTMPRERAFNHKYEITNLHQGRDTKNITEQNYRGDSSVISDLNKITIQIFDILPKILDKREPKYRQFMFAIYNPQYIRVARRNK